MLSRARLRVLGLSLSIAALSLTACGEATAPVDEAPATTEPAPITAPAPVNAAAVVGARLRADLIDSVQAALAPETRPAAQMFHAALSQRLEHLPDLAPADTSEPLIAFRVDAHTYCGTPAAERATAAAAALATQVAAIMDRAVQCGGACPAIPCEDLATARDALNTGSLSAGAAAERLHRAAQRTPVPSGETPAVWRESVFAAGLEARDTLDALVSALAMPQAPEAPAEDPAEPAAQPDHVQDLRAAAEALDATAAAGGRMIWADRLHGAGASDLIADLDLAAIAFTRLASLMERGGDDPLARLPDALGQAVADAGWHTDRAIALLETHGLNEPGRASSASECLTPESQSFASLAGTLSVAGDRMAACRETRQCEALRPDTVSLTSLARQPLTEAVAPMSRAAQALQPVADRIAQASCP